MSSPLSPGHIVAGRYREDLLLAAGEAIAGTMPVVLFL